MYEIKTGDLTEAERKSTYREKLLCEDKIYTVVSDVSGTMKKTKTHMIGCANKKNSYKPRCFHQRKQKHRCVWERKKTDRLKRFTYVNEIDLGITCFHDNKIIKFQVFSRKWVQSQNNWHVLTSCIRADWNSVRLSRGSYIW